MQRNLRNKPKYVDKVVREHNKKAKEQYGGDEKFEKIVLSSILFVIVVVLIFKYFLK